MAWFSWLGPVGKIIDTVATPIKEWQKRKSDVAKAKHEQDLAEIGFKTQLIMNRESHNQAWEIEALKANQKSRSPMQWLTFILLSLPFIIAWFNPALVAAYFTVSLQAIPLWYQQAFISIIGVIWGIANLKNAASGINKALLMRKHVNVDKMLNVPASKIIRPDSVKSSITENVNDIVEEILDDHKLNELYPDLKDDK